MRRAAWSRSAKTVANAPWHASRRGRRGQDLRPRPPPGPLGRSRCRAGPEASGDPDSACCAMRRRRVAPVALDCWTTMRTLCRERAVHACVIGTRLAPDLGHATDEQRHDEQRACPDDEDLSARPPAGAAVGGQRRHRRVTLLPGQTARNGASDDAFAVFSVLALDRHCTVGAIASTSTRSRWRSMRLSMPAMTLSVRRCGSRPRSSNFVLAAWK